MCSAKLHTGRFDIVINPLRLRPRHHILLILSSPTNSTTSPAVYNNIPHRLSILVTLNPRSTPEISRIETNSPLATPLSLQSYKTGVHPRSPLPFPPCHPLLSVCQSPETFRYSAAIPFVPSTLPDSLQPGIHRASLTSLRCVRLPRR